MSNKNIIIVLVSVVVVGLLCVCVAIGAFLWSQPSLDSALAGVTGPTSTPTPTLHIERTPVDTPVPPTPTTEVEEIATEVAEPSPTTDVVSESSPTTAPTPTEVALPPSTEERLLTAILPERDQRQLAMRLKMDGEEIPAVVTENAPPRELGDVDKFWVTDNQQQPPRQFEVEATLKYITPHSYWWIQDGFNINADALARSAERFENETYPTNRAFFGSEWSPGVDGDEHIHIFMGDVPGVAGYYSASNEYTKQAEPFSNEREMFFINLRAITPGNDYFDGVLSHEFQHMIHWYQDRNEDTWVNEGMSELATFINGYGSSNFSGAFIATPDTQLTGWADSPGAASANYGGSFMFMAYFLQRYGEEMTQAVVAHPANGIAGFNAVLEEAGHTERFEEIFADFLVANYLQDPEVNDGLWGYEDFRPGNANINKLYRVYPQSEQTTVFQYGADYIELTGFGDIEISFTGSTRVKVLANEPHSGQFQWYSHRGDDTNTRLTRTVDLSEVDQATLNYWIWYDIESDWDYGYVAISQNDGLSWTLLEAQDTVTTNPSGNAYGPGYTGSSGDWREQTIDISDFTGQEVLIRFEYVTDDAVNRPGWAVDDISIPEIGFMDDTENGLNGWDAEGFVLIDNILPQRFLVQVIEIGEDVTVQSIPLDETNFGTLTVEGLGDRIDRAILVISGLTPVTSEPATYEYELTDVSQ